MKKRMNVPTTPRSGSRFEVQVNYTPMEVKYISPITTYVGQARRKFWTSWYTEPTGIFYNDVTFVMDATTGNWPAIKELYNLCNRRGVKILIDEFDDNKKLTAMYTLYGTIMSITDSGFCSESEDTKLVEFCFRPDTFELTKA